MERARRIAVAVGRVLVALVSISVLVATAYGWSVYRGISTRIVTSDVLPETAPPGLDEPLTALLVGLDSRTDAAGNPLPPELLDQLRAGADEGQLHTDTIILLHIPAGPRAAATAISIPRDSYVPIAGGRGTHKINSAYRRGIHDAREELAAQGVTGAELDRQATEAGRRTLVATVQDLAGVTVDHYAEINLAGFVEITEALGGVPVCLNAAVREPLAGVDLPAGMQTVRGADALAFVRQRHGLDGGDLDRIARQQAFLAGFASTVLSSGTLADPARLDRVVRALTRYVVLDRGWQLDRLVEQFRRAYGGDITFRTIPTGAPDLRTPVDGIAVKVDAEQVRQFVAAVVDGGDSTSVTRAAGSPGTAAQATPTPDPTATPAITAAGVPCVD